MNDFSGFIKLRDFLKINDIYFEFDELGYVYGGLCYNFRFNFYFGIVLGCLVYFVCCLIVSFDMGIFYKGVFEVFINGIVLICNNEYNVEILINNMFGYCWFLVFNLCFGYFIDFKDNF